MCCVDDTDTDDYYYYLSVQWTTFSSAVKWWCTYSGTVWCLAVVPVFVC